MIGRITGIAMGITLLLGGSSASALSISGHNSNNIQIASTQSLSDTSKTCLHYTDHIYEVCTAYIYNSVLADLVPYYKYSFGSNSSLARFVSYRLGSRYTGQAYSTITSRVTNWPTGKKEVRIPSIKILSANVDLDTNTAVLTTQENWRVTTEAGQVIYSETNAPHTITMEKVPSYILHKWIVTNIQ